MLLSIDPFYSNICTATGIDIREFILLYPCESITWKDTTFRICLYQAASDSILTVNPEKKKDNKKKRDASKFRTDGVN